MQPLKLITIGPVSSGKTVISNFLADASEIPYDYHPTQGVRILEFEMEGLTVYNKNISKDIELWDCSGDHKFKSCWPIIKKDVHGVILVYSAKSVNSIKELQELYDYFIVQTKLGPDMCVIFYYNPDKIMPEISKAVSSTFPKVSHVKCNIEEGGNKLQSDFRAFLSSLMTKLQEYGDQDQIIIRDNILFVK